MLHLIGGRGRLGRALAARWAASELRLLPRDTYADWWRAGASAAVARHFAAHAAPGDTVCLLAGVLDPALPEAEHERVNLLLPAQVIEGALSAGLRVVSFGTVMEALVARPNPYVASKARLGRLVAERAARGEAALHLRIHTLYGGGAPAPFMFLGQMLDALRAQRPFAMSSGRQLREYHHVDDDARAIEAVLAAQAGGVIELNCGAPLSLRELATGVFAALGFEHSLRLGAMPDPDEDNYGAAPARPALLDGVHFRDAVPGVAHELRRQLDLSIVTQNA